MSIRIPTPILLVLAAILAIVAGYCLYLSSYGVRVHSADISSYDDCVAAGYPILESYPTQCRTPDGRMFVNPDQQVVLTP